jgi:VanZ family protein
MLHKLLAAAAWVALALLVFVTISPLQTRPVVTENANIERFAAFAIVGVLFGLAYPRRLVIDASFVVIAAGVLETLQLLTPDRHGHIADALVKAAGGAFGVAMALIVLFIARRYQARVNQ